MEKLLTVNDEVAAALAAGDPVVAFESTVIAQGLPRPQNGETACLMEAAVGELGAVPATIAVLDGRMVAGLSPAQIGLLASAASSAKVSRSDLAAVLASGRPGATTVAGTAFIAARAGIYVLATGGIGGVHRGAESSFDISADLAEIARTPVAVVCAGAKVILDLPRTLEILESLGVPVVGYVTNEFPAFFSRESGLQLHHRVETPEEAARLMEMQWDLGIAGGIIFANPPPANSALTRKELESLIAGALESPEAAGVRGKAVTPFLLEGLVRRSGGRTLQTNIALLIHNARVAARVAVAFSARKRQNKGSSGYYGR